MTRTPTFLVLVTASVGFGSSCSQPDPIAPPTGGLVVDSTVPIANQQSAPFSGSLVVFFDRALDAATVDGTTIGALTANGQTVQANVTYDPARRAVLINGPLMPSADYRGIATTAIRGTGGESLPNDFIWNFRTRPGARVVIDPIGGVATVPVVAVDQGGGIHAAYVDSTTGGVRYLRCLADCGTATNWAAATIGTDAGVGSRIDLSVSTDGKPVVAFYSASQGALVVASCPSDCEAVSSWQSVVLDDAAGDVGFSPSLTRTADGGLHVIYRDQGRGNIRYSSCLAGCTAAGGWTPAVVIDSGSDRGIITDLAVGVGGALVAIWTAEVDDFLVFGSCPAGCASASAWSMLELTATAGVTEQIELAVDLANRPVVTLGRQGFVGTAICRSTDCGSQTNWTFINLADDALPGAHIALVIDSMDRIHVAYAGDFGGLRYLSCTRICDGGTSFWAGGSLDTGAENGDAAVAANGEGAPQVIVRLSTGQLAFVR